MKTKWKTGGYGREMIVKAEVVRETENSVFVIVLGFSGAKERRVNKQGSYESYFDSWDEAKAYLMRKAESNLQTARNALQRAQDELGNVKGLKKPEAA